MKQSSLLSSHKWFRVSFVVCLVALASAVSARAQDAKGSTVATPATGNDVKTIEKGAPGGVAIHPLFVDIMKVRGLKKSSGTTPSRNPSKSIGNAAVPANAAERSRESGHSNVAPFAFETRAHGNGADDEGVGQTLPLWTFRVRASRDGNKYSGAMVGRNPFENPGKTSVPTKVIPLIIKTQTVGVSFDPKTGIIATQPGSAIFDPTQADNVCLTAPNNVPTDLVRQSPIFSPAKFVFGGTDVGTTQYSDAFQRANFWNALGEDRDAYHVLLQPVQFLDPIVLEVPDVYGLALTDGLFLGPPPFCAPFGIVDINWFDTYLTGTVIPSLAGDVDPTNFPIFLVYNVAWASPANNLFTCCALGYHGTTGFPIPTQTYSPAEFDTSGFFINAAGSTAPFSDTAILSHEVDEWVNDPMVSNPTPPWGHTGQVMGCQANLEVGDPLSGTNIPAVTMPNGFTYHLQELAFFSWFFGAPSAGVNGWFSDNGTFLTDAGAPCH
jgi:hypothetical protein